MLLDNEVVNENMSNVEIDSSSVKVSESRQAPLL